MNGWTWRYEGYDPEREGLREALCTLGNGYFATRGAAPETPADGTHYPGTYAAGCYNRLVSDVAGHRVENEDMVNLPDWLPLRYRLRDDDVPPGPWLSPDAPELDAHRQELHLRRGELTRHSSYRTAEGGVLDVEQARLVHMGEAHLATMRTTFTARGWSGRIDIESALEGDVRNAGVPRYRGLANRHLTGWLTGAGGPDTVWLRCRTTSSGIGVALAARTTVTPEAEARRPVLTPRRAATHLTVPLAPDRPVVVEKTVALHTSRDSAISDPLHAALEAVTAAPGFRALQRSHRAAWQELWRDARLDVPGGTGRILRLHTFHVLQTLSPHTVEVDAGVPARGLHGEAYRGHVFWDELFVLPYLNLHFPEVSRALLQYRYRRLPRARRLAAREGRRGAMYPWQSGSDGREETQTLHLNPVSGRWVPDHSRLQHHVGSAVAYNVWQYCHTTGDDAYLQAEGAETLLQIARFWSDSARWDDALQRYSIAGVVGPDEYHDAYPDAAEPGLRDNTYTNVTAAWVLWRGLELLSELPAPRKEALFARTGLDAAELERWADVSHRLRVPYHEGVISQFDGYGGLAELDWEKYRERYGDIRRLDRILEAEGDTVNRYRASKQADVLMLGYLFSPTELTELFERLGYRLDDDLWRATVDHYLRRTSHGSTLSSLVHAWVLARERRPDAWRHCQEALDGDVADVQGGTTAEGIHLGAMGGTLDLVQRGLTGLEIRHHALSMDPAPLPQLSKFGFTLRYRGHWEVDVAVRREGVRVHVPRSGSTPVQLLLRDRPYTIAPGEKRWLDLP